MRTMNVKLSALALAACASLPAQALSIGSGFEEFFFGGPGSAWDTTFNFVLATDALLQVTDGFLSGDRFEVFDGATSLGLTSAPTSVGDEILDDYAAALADPRWSSGEFLLTAGSYSISGTAVDSPFQGGRAALRLVAVAPVPEPSTYALMLGGLGLVGFLARRRERKAA